MKKLILIPLLAFGCVSTKTVTNSDGSEHQKISCLKMEDCYSEARKICGGKYKVLNKTTEESGLNGNIGTSQDILIRCVSRND